MAKALESDKVMFEIYCDRTYGAGYRVVYFTELGDRDRDREFTHALRGEHVFDGFLRNQGKDAAKAVIAGILQRLNQGDPDQAPRVSAVEILELLRPYTP